MIRRLVAFRSTICSVADGFVASSMSNVQTHNEPGSLGCEEVREEVFEDVGPRGDCSAGSLGRIEVCVDV